MVGSIRGHALETGFSGVIRWDHAGDTRLSEAFGYAHRGFEVPNTVDTRIAIASRGKTFTALAVVSLIVDGVLSLDTTARSVLGQDLPLIADDVDGHLQHHRRCLAGGRTRTAVARRCRNVTISFV